MHVPTNGVSSSRLRSIGTIRSLTQLFKCLHLWPRHCGIDATSTCTAPSLLEWLEECEVVQQILQHNLHHARQYLKTQADKKRTERTFELGEDVFIKLQPYVQSSVVRRSSKLAFCYFGPCSIIWCINHIAYEVDLPPESKIYPIFHVSQLHKVPKPGRREQWSVGSDMDVTWEDKLELQHWYPEALAWGQAKSQGGGMSTTALMIKTATRTWASLVTKFGPRGLSSPTNATSDQSGRVDPGHASSSSGYISTSDNDLKIILGITAERWRQSLL